MDADGANVSALECRTSDFETQGSALKKFFKILNILECHKLIERLDKWNDLGAEVAEDRSLGLVCKNSKSDQFFYHFSSFKSTVLFWDYKMIEQVVKAIVWVICWMKLT